MESTMTMINLNEIKNLDIVKVLIPSPSQRDVINSVVNNGQLVPVHMDKNYNLIDGRLRVQACLESGKTSVGAIFIDGMDTKQEQSRSKYIMNTHRYNMSVIERSALALEATEHIDNVEHRQEEYTKLGIKHSQDDMKKFSKSHISKYKKIALLPDDVKQKMNLYEIPLNASYELAKAFGDTLSKDNLLSVLEDIKELSDRKGVSKIKSYIKGLNGGSKDEEIDVGPIKFRKNVILIDIHEYCDGNDSKTLLTDDDKEKIEEIINNIFAYLRDKENSCNNSEGMTV